MDRSDLFICGEQGYHTYRIPALVVSASGTVLAFCEARRHSGRDDDEIDILLRRSLDSGVTWQSPQLVVADGDRTCGNPCKEGTSAYSDLAVAPGGAILCFYEADSYARLVLARFDSKWLDQ